MPRIAKLTESKASLEIQTFLIAKKWWVRKTHGNVYSMGLPDLSVARKKDGKLMYIELKIIHTQKRYTNLVIFNSLKGPQIGVILMLARIRAPVYIAAKCPEGWLLARPPFKSDEVIYPMELEELYGYINE
jgi:hypothetical protein